MKRTLLIALAFALGVALLTSSVWAHGGSFRGPNGGVPPDGRAPTDPEPPPPGPSDPGTPGPVSPGDPNPGPSTPPDQGHDTPDGSQPPAPAPTPGKRTRPTTPRLTFESWRYWWAYNNADILSLKTHIYNKGAPTASALHYSSGRDRNNRVQVSRPTLRAIQTHILPALLASIQRPGEHDDIVGGDIVAIGKIGSFKHIDLFQAVLNNNFTSRRGKRIKFGYQATESAALALGLLPNLDANAKDAVRDMCLEAIGNDRLNRRDRAWAAVSLGLQRDRKAVEPLVELLSKKHRYADDNIPAGILVALGLIGDKEVVAPLVDAFERGNLFGRNIRSNARLRAFAGYALAKIGDSKKSLPAVIRVLRARSIGIITKRSAAIAAGVLAARSEDDEMRKDTVSALFHYMRHSKGDPSGNNFAIIALTQIGTPRAVSRVLDIMENGRYGQRPFAALGLATRVWYMDHAAKRKQGAAMDRDRREKIVNKLRKLSEKAKDSDTRAAFMLSRGLVKDKSAIDDLVKIVAKRSGAAVLRGYAAVALGLIGETREDVKDALRLALAERKSLDLRRNAATGLGLLHDARVVTDLLKELKKARSFAVQGQLITAIGTIGDQRAIQPLVELLEDRGQPAQTRAMAAVGLGMIGDLNPLPKLARLSKNYNYRASIKDVDELLFIL